MTLNDYKSMAGDRRMGIRSLPVMLGPQRAAVVAAWVMALPQAVVVALLLEWGAPAHAGGVALLLIAQVWMLRRFIAAPERQALWYSGFGVPLYVLGMLVSAFALQTLTRAAT
jgi:chlorophyll synthase